MAEAGPKKWGKLGRRGAGVLGEDKETASAKFRNVIDREKAERLALREAGEAAEVDEASESPKAKKGKPTFTLQPDEWELADEIHDEAEGAVVRSRAAAPQSGNTARDQRKRISETAENSDLDDIEDDVRVELAKAVGAKKLDQYEKKLRDASRAFDGERFLDAERMLKRLADEAPGAASVRELYGLSLYRLGRWKLAARELEAYRILAHSTDQHPVLADCYRALRHYKKVDDLWVELRAASPSGPIVTEGRIVAAGALSDRGRLTDAIKLLEQGWSFPKRAKEHHLRRGYALADCYERAGDVVRAREMFAKIRSSDPFFADVQRREKALA